MGKVGSDISLQMASGLGGWILLTISYSTRTRGCQMKLARIMFKTKNSRLLAVDFLPADALGAKKCLQGLKGRQGKYLEETTLLKCPHQAQEIFELKIITDWESTQRNYHICLYLFLTYRRSAYGHC